MDHQQSVDYFKSIPWVAKILSQPGTHTFIPSHRDTGAQRSFEIIESKDKLLAQSLNNPSAIPHCIGFYRDASIATATTTGPTFLFNEATLLFDLHPGATGFSGTIHGGLQGVLMDEAMGNLMYTSNILHQTLKASGKTDFPPELMDLNATPIMTTGINIRFIKPVMLPQVIAVTAKLSKIDGRKVFMDVSVEGEGGVVLVKGTGEWKTLLRPAKKL